MDDHELIGIRITRRPTRRDSLITPNRDFAGRANSSYA